MNRRTGTVSTVLAMAVALQSLAATGGSIPLELPRPDGKPGNAAKPVKVYILAGQSNMVGMGDISGARPLYPSVFLSADPAIVPGHHAGRRVGRGHGSWRCSTAERPPCTKARMIRSG